MQPERIAIIGSGISGLSAAWLLSKSCDVTLFERSSRIGGHTNTIDAMTPDGPVAVDTGFIVYNERNYPNLTALFGYLGVKTAPTDMGLAVSTTNGGMEYSGKHLGGLFGQRRNVVRLRHWQMVADILRFFRWAESQAADLDDDVTTGEFLERFGYSPAFIEDHILPISAAIWSTPARSMLDFPARTFITFLANHGLLQVNNRPNWRTVVGGARTYIEQLVEDGDFQIETGARIAQVTRDASGIDLRFETGQHRRFDQVIFACHADQVLPMLPDASDTERNTLSAFRFTPNRAVLHTDRRFMPKRTRLWSAWNYLRTGRGADAELSLTYWMNRLQPLATTTNLFVTLNPMHDIAPGAVHKVIDYEHPLFDVQAIAAQRGMCQIQGVRRTWFAGAWLGYGFHEDGLQSGLEVAERIGTIDRPWSVDDARGRIAHNWPDEEAPLWAAE